MCARVLELGKLGKTKEQIAVDLQICKKTRQDWERLHPEFAAAIKEAQHLILGPIGKASRRKSHPVNARPMRWP